MIGVFVCDLPYEINGLNKLESLCENHIIYVHFSRRGMLECHTGADPGICVRGPSPLPSYPFPFPPLRSRPSVLRLGGLGERSSSTSGSGRSPAAIRFLVNCRLKIAPVVAMISLQKIPVHDRSQKTRYVILYVNHNMPSIVQWDPKVSVLLMVRKTTSAQSERHAKSNTSVVLQGDFSRL